MGQQLGGFFAEEAELSRYAGQLARRWKKKGLTELIIGLSGELGAGKTTWVRGMLRGLGYEGRVPSPTFSLVEPYPLDDLTVLHLDLYRLEGAAALEDLGLRDWLAEPETWLLIEWPERWPAFERLGNIRISLGIEKLGRRVEMTPFSSIEI